MGKRKFDESVANELENHILTEFKENEDFLDLAVGYLDDYIEKDPDSSEAYYIRSELCCEIEAFEHALSDVQTAISLDPAVAKMYNTRGKIYANTAEIDKALKDFNKAIELDANFVDAYTNRANMYLKKKDFQNAISDCTKAIEVMPTNDRSCEPYHNRLLAYANIGELAKALDDCNMVVQLAPKNADVHMRRGTIHAQLGNKQEAISDFEKSLELDPNSANVTLIQNSLKRLKRGCYVATCVYGSYDCPEVWTLRRYRDDQLLNSWFGRRLVRVYYAVSPKIVKLFGNQKWFSKLCKPIINSIVRKLQNSGIDSSPYSDM